MVLGFESLPGSKLRYPSEFLEPRGALRAPCGNSARGAKDFFGVEKSARARRRGFEPTFRRKSLFASRFSPEATISAWLASFMKARQSSSQRLPFRSKSF